MPVKWEKTSTGWQCTVETPGYQPQVFKGATKAQVADALAEAQVNSTAAIVELKSGRNPQRRNPEPPAKPAPKPLAPAEKIQAAAEITRPETIEKAVTRVVESIVGPIDELKNVVSTAPASRERQAGEDAVRAATEFTNGTPDWYPSEFNKTKLVQYMRTMRMDNTKRESYDQAYSELSAAGLLQPKPEPSSEQEPAPAGGRIDTPRRTAPPPPVSTGVTSRDVRGSAPPPAAGPRLKYTRAQTDAMAIGARKYKELYTGDPEFRKAADFYATQPARRAS